jgi:hypothetical protein
MTTHESPGFLRRLCTVFGASLKRGVLGQSAHDYGKHFTGSDEYWDSVIAAQLGWPQKSIGDIARRPPEPEGEPVHGWTKRQLDDYLARNPGYRSTYEAELQKRSYTATPEANGSLFDWFGFWRMNHDKAASRPGPNATKHAPQSHTDSLCHL